ncbi:MAG: Wzz/FepE/Etk N-terminal domain-containing protein [Melioribacteraceae bacterium]|nr:MAG: Wzz/FepE/Etk N-terminal domain-containing protein [Melioribacteraceae bacterium]
MNNQETQIQEQKMTGSPLVEFVTTIVRYRYFLVIFILSITIIATVYALVAPKWYKSTSVVLAAEQSSLLGSLGGLSSIVKGFSASSGLASLTGNTETDRYLAILQSSTVYDNVIKKFNLREVYEMEDDYYEKLVKELQGNVNMEVGDEGQLIISVYDKDKQRAADMANYFVDQLNEVNTRMHVFNAKANREFIEKRYFKNLADIDSLEYAMRDFQEKYGVIAVPEQLKTTVTAMAAMYGQLVEKQLELKVLEQSLNENHPLVSISKAQVNELEKRINSMSTTGSKMTDDDVNLLIPFRQAPELGRNYLKIYRDLEIQYEILEFVTPLYEQAKVEEVRNTPSVLVLDYAGPAERKAKPKGTIYLAVSFVISLLLGLFIVFSIHLLKKFNNLQDSRSIYIKDSLYNDYVKLRKLIKKS